MKNLILFTSVIALMATKTACAAADTADCANMPSCEALGYTDLVAECPKDSSSTSKASALLCPSDSTKGKCIYEAAIGQVAYFPKICPKKNGWLMCDGTLYTKAQYPLLYSVLNTTFCTNNHGSSSAACTAGTNFKVPDYRGYFLRASTPYSPKAYAPQAERLPNLRGYFGLNSQSLADEKLFTRILNINQDSVTRTWRRPNGDAISKTTMWKDDKGNWIGLDAVSNGSWTQHSIQFNASVHNNIYRAASSEAHVVPANIAVYPCIYAGKCVGSGCF